MDCRCEGQKVTVASTGEVTAFVQANIQMWWPRESALALVLDEMVTADKIYVLHHQAVQFYGARKDS